VSLPPPPPGSSSNEFLLPPSGAPSGFQDFGVTNFSRREEVTHAKPFFILLCVLFLVISIILSAVGGSSTWIALIGYLLTPFGATLALGMDLLYQRRSIAKNPWFVANANFSKILRFQVLIAYLIMIPHALTIASNFSAYLAH